MKTSPKLKVEILFDPAILLPGIFLKELKTSYYRDPCVPMFIAPPFIIATCRKVFICQSADEGIKKRSIYT